MFNKLAINPAYAGSKEALSLMALYRYQWLRIDGAPQTANINVHAPILGRRVGIGLRLVNDQIGMINTTYVKMSYAYRLLFKNGNVLSAGIGVEFDHGRYDWSRAEILDAGDNEIPFGQPSRSAFNVGGGIYYTGKRFYIGLSLPEIMRNSLYSDTFIGQSAIKDLRSYYLMAGLLLDISDKVAFKPSVLASYVPNSPFDLDINLSLVFLNTFWVGATYRMNDSVDAVLQYKINRQWTVGVATDFTASELSTYTPGSAEIMLEYVFDYANDRLNNIRFFD